MLSTFGDYLKHLRKRAGMTQHDLAAATGYSRSYISALEQNARLPDLETLLQTYVPALGLQEEPHLAAHLVELAALARGERPPFLPVPMCNRRRAHTHQTWKSVNTAYPCFQQKYLGASGRSTIYAGGCWVIMDAC